MILFQSKKHRQVILAGALLCGTMFFNAAKASEELMEKAGCIACHRIDEKLIGPAYREVAKKYRSSPREQTMIYLTDKVREGGEGVWGDIPMAPNPPSKISDEDLKKLLEWILSL